MKKFTFILVALLVVSFSGLAIAANVPGAVDPKNGPEVWITEVYNNTTALTAGDVVVWDISSSTGDNDNYVTTTTTEDTQLVAGIVWPVGIAAADTGSIAIRGVVDCDINGATSAGAILCTADTAGESKNCEVDHFAFGHALASGTNTTVKCYVNP